MNGSEILPSSDSGVMGSEIISGKCETTAALTADRQQGLLWSMTDVR